jgi:isochorismate hydrolase
MQFFGKGAFMRDIRACAVTDAMADSRLQDQKAGLASMSWLRACVVDTNRAFDSLNARSQ